MGAPYRAPLLSKDCSLSDKTRASPGRTVVYRFPARGDSMSEVGTRPVPLGLTERDVDDAIERLTAELGADKVITDAAALREFRDPFQVRDVRRLRGVGGRHADDASRRSRRSSDRQRDEGPAVAHRPGQEQRLRRRRAAGARLGDGLAPQHEPRPRDQRGARLRDRRAGRELVRPLRGDQGRRPQPRRLHRRHRLGRRRRQHARARRHLHALRRRPGLAVRVGGGARPTAT